MEYYGNNDYRNYHLAHHGILGMHWGIRRYQPYDVGYQRKNGESGVERISRARADDDIRISRKTANRVKKVVTASALIGVGYWAGKHPEQAKKAATLVAKSLPKIGKKAASIGLKGAKATAKFVAKNAPKVAKGTKTATKATAKFVAKNAPKVAKGTKIASKATAKFVAKNAPKVASAGAKGTKMATKAIGKVGKKFYYEIKNKNNGDFAYEVIKARKGGSSIRAVLRK